MRKIILSIFTILISTSIFSQKLAVINYENIQDLKQLFNNAEIAIHYYADNIAIATCYNNFNQDLTILEEDGFKSTNRYYIVWFHKTKDQGYIGDISKEASILVENEKYLVVSMSKEAALPPPVDGRVVN